MTDSFINTDIRQKISNKEIHYSQKWQIMRVTAFELVLWACISKGVFEDGHMMPTHLVEFSKQKWNPDFCPEWDITIMNTKYPCPFSQMKPLSPSFRAVHYKYILEKRVWENSSWWSIHKMYRENCEGPIVTYLSMGTIPDQVEIKCLMHLCWSPSLCQNPSTNTICLSPN